MIWVVLFAAMQILLPPGPLQPTPGAAPQQAYIAGTGPATPAAPIEPAKRVTANRDGGRGDLVPQQQTRTPHAAQARGRLIDLFV